MKQLNLSRMTAGGPQLIEASAGTGKTWTIAALYMLLLLEQELRPEEILVVTYTKAATAELRDRIRGRLTTTLELFSTERPAADELETLLQSTIADRERAARLLTRALYAFDDAAIHTIHSFCQRALMDNAFESGSLFDTEMINDQDAIVREVCDDFWRNRILGGDRLFLDGLVRAGWTPEKLAQPFKGQYQNPALKVIPLAADPDLTTVAAERVHIFADLVHLWRGERDVIIAQVAGANLHQSSYKPAQIDKAVATLDLWLTGSDPGSDCSGLKLFTRSSLRKAEKKETIPPTHPFFDLCQEMSESNVRFEQAFREKLIHCQIDLHQWLREELPRRKRARNRRCFDDLLLDLHQALAGPGGDRLAGTLSTRYRAALIDEFQDTDPFQWQIFARIAGIPATTAAADTGEAAALTRPSATLSQWERVNCVLSPSGREIERGTSYPLYVIGDPKQAIYSFRGADIFAYLAAARSIPPDGCQTLDTNRRSTPQLVTAVNTLFAGADDPFRCRGIAFNPVRSGRDVSHCLLSNGSAVQQPLQLWVFQRKDQTKPAAKPDATRAIVRCVAEEIARLLAGGTEIIDKKGRRPLGPGDIAVLVRTHTQADLVQEALRERAVPAVQHGSSTIFQSGEAMDLLRILRAVHEPARERLLREALLTRSMGLSANEVALCLERIDDDRQWGSWLRRFRELHAAAAGGGVITLVERLLGDCGVRLRTLAQAGGERVLTNILHCAELLHRAEIESGLGLEGLIVWLERRIAANDEDETALLRLETDDNAVQLSTIHASKGLEFPVVFLPFSWESPSHRNSTVLFHDGVGDLTLDLGSADLADNTAAFQAERDAEAARLLYVALTRAEYLCYVAWGSMGDAADSPLFRLLHAGATDDPKQFKALSDGALLAELQRFPVDSGIHAAPMPQGVAAPPYRPSRPAAAGLSCHTLPREIQGDWRVSSFTSLTAGSERGQQPRDYDTLRPSAESLPPGDSSPRTAACSIFTFPRGSSAGTCLHEIFERLDFATITPGQIAQVAGARLQANGYDDTWLPAVAGMVAAVTTAPLIADDPDFNLAQLNPGAWRSELEFFLPVGHLSPDALHRLFDGLLDPLRHGNFAATLATLNFRQSRGMLQGFIDMVFEHRGRYYLIDWKSNHLGASSADYNQTAMSHAMADHAYILQYHLYTLALDRHLQRHLPGYRYEDHFGGIIYLFLRGVDPSDCELGIYRDKPSPTFLERAADLILL